MAAATLGEAMRHARGLGLARLDAELLLAHVCGIPRSRVVARPEQVLEAACGERFLELADRRALGEPLAYLTGRKGFMNIELEVTADVLIPRPETELLVTTALTLPLPERACVLELGTGSGAIALALAQARPAWGILATDVSPAALAVAGRNVSRIAPARVRLIGSDWFAALAPERFDLLLANPPYVAAGDPELAADVAAHEPGLALFAAEAGLADLAALAAAAPERLRPDGFILLEHGHRQGGAVRRLLHAVGLKQVRSLTDDAAKERVTIARQPP
ncbi:MAG: peptide chain release factor N(5)-glutamine methyltransferase [Gammaproteobacteria bacterium]|nr:MAG: peptide chain release factor N(5)-glutamine methyltransferase [Gammaproteobacteria bacterium]